MFAPLWNTYQIAERQQIAEQIARLNPAFDQMYASLKKGRIYSSTVPRGFLEWIHPNMLNNEPHPCLVFIPYSYTSQQKYLVKVFLHGLVSTTNKRGFIDEIIDQKSTTFEKRAYISVYPAGWKNSMWWTESQLENLVNIIGHLKQTYNIDENRVHLAGMSDGGTGVFYMANTHPTPWASFFPYLANIGGLNALSKRQVYASNFENRPFLIVNAEKDHVFPPKIVIPYMELLRRAGIVMNFHMLKDAGHDMFWFPRVKNKVIKFVNKQLRQPFPDQLYWETETTQKHQRIHWLCIDQLTKTPEEQERLVGINTILNYKRAMFRRELMSGRVFVEKKGNEVNITSQNVATLTLLCSPDHFDFARPVKVVANKALVYEGKLKPSVKTLLKWHAIDDDRTMLYAAELKVKINQTF